MNEYPYLLGQLLKVSDCLHELYCIKVRKNLPSQFIGSSLYVSAAERPLQAFSLLSVRMLPYITWAKTHHDECIEWTDKNEVAHKGPSAGYYLMQYRLVADKLKKVELPHTAFNDAEKAQLFIGYLASFEKNDKDIAIEEDNNL